MIKQAVSDIDINKCFAVMAELRPHLQEDTFLAVVRHMEKEGFRMACIEAGDEVVAVAGYRVFTNLFLGKNLYVDDLVTAARARSRGHGATLLSWLRLVAIEEDCAHFHLDSGTQRQQAHKFYFRQGLCISSYHFSASLDRN